MHPSQFDGRDQVVTAKVVSLSTLVAVTLVVPYMDHSAAHDPLRS